MSNTYNAKHPNIQEEFNNLVGSCKYKASVEAKTLVRDFISHPKSMDPHAKHTYSRSIRKILINIKNILYGRHKNLSNYSNFSSIMDNFKCILKYPGQIKINTREKKDLSQIKFIYFPFHQLPELTVYMWADDFSDQTHIVKKLSTHIPFRLKLLVREHTHNVGRRPYTYYNLWKKISNIIVGSIYRSQYEYIKHSESVITINGSTGWEALLLKKPLFTLQNTLYDLTGYHKKLDNISQIGGVYNDHCEFINNMSDKKYYLKIYAYIDAVINTTVKENQGGAKKLIENIKLNSSLNNQEYNFWKK
jgi:hypothetical protein